MSKKSLAAPLSLLLGLAACGGAPTSTPAEAGASARDPVAASSATATAAPTATATSPASAKTSGSASVGFAEVVERLSEPDGEFFSDNVISNETSYLQVADALGKRAGGGAYIGVGPEQNFTYIALLRPEVAFVVDIRRQNLVLHLLYRAAFEEATSRAHFVALMLGRAYVAEGDPGASGTIDQVLAHATRGAVLDGPAFAALQARLRKSIEAYVHLDARDLRGLELSHEAFHKGQLETRFSLKQANGRVYPSIGELFREKGPGGAAGGFLASEEAFRTVQSLERSGRVIPLVGDFGGDRALPGVASWLHEHRVNVRAFYVSNVEQYLFEPKVWAKWTRNIEALPIDDKSVFIRAYLDQGKKHPLQMRGHRTATVLQRIVDFDDHQKKTPYASFWSVANEPFEG